jgi:hypothetical protein
MAKFIEVKSPTGTYSYFVNVDAVEYVSQSAAKSGEASLHFGKDNLLNIGEGAAVFVSRAGDDRS